MTSGYTDVPSPGGWLKLWGLAIGSAVLIGGGVYTGGQLAVGKFQGGVAYHRAEYPVQAEATTRTQFFSYLNPFNETAAVILSLQNGVLLDETPSPATRIDVGTATGSTASGQNIFNDLLLSGANRYLSTYGTGASAFRQNGMVLLAPRNSSGARFLTGTYSKGSGQTVSGNNAGFVQFDVLPCSAIGTVDC